MGDLEAALEDLDRVIEAEPKDSEALLWRASARRDSGDTEGMFDDLKPGGRFADHPVWQLQRKQADLKFRDDGSDEPWSNSPSHLCLLVQLYGTDAVRLESLYDLEAPRSHVARCLRRCVGGLGKR